MQAAGALVAVAPTESVSVNLPHPSGRWHQAEWTMTLALATLPVTILVDPATIETSSFRHILDWGVSPHHLALMALLVVIVRAVSLTYNGQLEPWSAYGRILGAFLAGFLWLEMAMALLQLSVTLNRPPSVGIGFWLIFAASEIWTCFRAAADAFDRA